MKALTASIIAVVFVAVIVAALNPGHTAGVVLAFGSSFALFANVMACERPRDAERAPDAPGRAALLVDWN
jgi:hypothetical protein